MIESIEIKNFRCFKDTKIAKFGLVNLFGGMNNAGKTALLEALYLTASPTPSSLLFLHSAIRREDSKFGKERPENVWDNLFFQQDKKEKITLQCIDDEKSRISVTITCDEKANELLTIFENADEEMNTSYTASLSSINTTKSILQFDWNNGFENSEFILIASKSGIATGVNKDEPHKNEINKSHFIPSSMRQSNYHLATEYEKARFDKKADSLLKAFKIIDNTIEKIEVFAIGSPVLYLQRENGERMPITLFGDAMNKLADIILKIVNNSKGVILIDEIENGIHYTAQAELWEMLFKLAIAYETQIFATTHSSEMIKAFAKVAQEFSDKAAYFEMAKSEKTGLIKGIRHDVDTLRFELDRNVAIRGE